MKELDIVFSKLTQEEHFYKIKDNFAELGIDVFRTNKSGELKLKSLNELFRELSDKWEELE
jgi:hypothetical protein